MLHSLHSEMDDDAVLKGIYQWTFEQRLAPIKQVVKAQFNEVFPIEYYC